MAFPDVNFEKAQGFEPRLNPLYRQPERGIQ